MTHNNAPAIPIAVGGSANETLISTAISRTTAPGPINTSRTLIAPPAVGTKRGLAEDDAPYPTATPVGFAPGSHLHARGNKLNRLD